MILSSSQNPIIKTIKKCLRQKKARLEQNSFIIETEKQVLEYLHHYPQHIQALFVREDYQSPPAIHASFHKTYIIKNELFSHCHSTKTSCGIIATVSLPPPKKTIDTNQTKNIWYLDHLSNPQNVGTLLRNAIAFNVSLVILSEHCADITHPESIRALTTCIHHIPIFLGSINTLQMLSATHSIIALDSNAPTPLTQLPSNHCVIFGSETGLSTEINTLEKLKKRTLPTSKKSNSLNVAACSAIVGYLSRDPCIQN